MTLRIAISGSACTGKSTLAAVLAEALELPLIPEAMRRHLEAGNPRLDRISCSQAAAVLEDFRQELLGAEQECGAFVADNSALDLEAYGRWYGCGGDPDTRDWAGRYDAVVLLPAGVLPYERDGVRQNDPEVEARFQRLLERLAEASALAPVILHLPRGLRTPESRAAWVLSRLRGTSPAPRSAAAGLVDAAGQV
jgi:nicotinamide riboside kinase